MFSTNGLQIECVFFVQVNFILEPACLCEGIWPEAWGE